MAYEKSNLEYIDLSDYDDETADEIIGNKSLLFWHVEEPDYPLLVEHTAERFGFDPDEYTDEWGVLDIDSLEELILERAESGQYGEYVLVEYGNHGYTKNCVYLMEKKVVEDLVALLKKREEE